MNTQAPKKCPECGCDMIERKGVSKTTNKPYHFWGCSGFPNCKFSWKPPLKQDLMFDWLKELVEWKREQEQKETAKRVEGSEITDEEIPVIEKEEEFPGF